MAVVVRVAAAVAVVVAPAATAAVAPVATVAVAMAAIIAAYGVRRQRRRNRLAADGAHPEPDRRQKARRFAFWR